MDQTHIGYTYWQQPVRNAMPGVQEIQVPPRGELGVAVEGSEASWPSDAGGAATLPALSVFDGQPRYIDIFNRGRQPFEYSVSASQPWLQTAVPRGTVERELRIWVSARWPEVPVGAERAVVTVTGPDGARVDVAVPILNPRSPRPGDLDGFVEANGYVSMEAEHFTRAIAPQGREWMVIPNHGRTLSGVTGWPVPAAPLDPTGGMRLEYWMYLFTKGTVSVEAQVAPTQKFQPGSGFRYGVSFDDEAPQVVNLHRDESLAAWEREVADGAKVLTSKHSIAAPGYHTLKIWALDPGVVIQKLVVRTTAPRRSYLGPPESPRGPIAVR